MSTNTNNTPPLPKGWVWVRLGEVSNINPQLPNKNLPEELEVTFLPMKAVSEETGIYDLSIIRHFRDVKKGYTSFINGDIIFAKITPCMENGKIAVLDNLKNGIGFGSTEFHVIRIYEKTISHKYIFYYLIQKGLEKKRREA